MTTNWKDKYKNVDFYESVWYWHKTETFSGNSTWSPIRVARLWSKEYDCWNLFAYGISQNPVPISEDFPNGPKCLTPDDITTMNKTQVFAEDIFKNLNKDKPFTFVYDGRFYSIREE